MITTTFEVRRLPMRRFEIVRVERSPMKLTIVTRFATRSTRALAEAKAAQLSERSENQRITFGETER